MLGDYEEQICGVGLELEKAGIHDDVVVAGCLRWGSAHQSGAIFRGDVLVSVNDTSVFGLPLVRVREAIRGLAGSTVKLRLKHAARGGHARIFDIVLERQHCLTPAQAAPGTSEASCRRHLSSETQGSYTKILDQPLGLADGSFDSTFASEAASRRGSRFRLGISREELLIQQKGVADSVNENDAHSIIWTSENEDLPHLPVYEARLHQFTGIRRRDLGSEHECHDMRQHTMEQSISQMSRVSHSEHQGLQAEGYDTRRASEGQVANRNGQQTSEQGQEQAFQAQGDRDLELRDDKGIIADGKESSIEREDPFLPSLSATPETQKMSSSPARPGSADRQGIGEERLAIGRPANRPSRPPLYSLRSDISDSKPPESLGANLSAARRTELKCDEEIYVQNAVLTSENRRLKLCIEDLEALQRTAEEAEEDARKAKQSNREMDERLQVQLERIEGLKRELNNARAREQTLREQLKQIPNLESNQKNLKQCMAHAQHIVLELLARVQETSDETASVRVEVQRSEEAWCREKERRAEQERQHEAEREHANECESAKARDMQNAFLEQTRLLEEEIKLQRARAETQEGKLYAACQAVEEEHRRAAKAEHDKEDALKKISNLGMRIKELEDELANAKVGQRRAEDARDQAQNDKSKLCWHLEKEMEGVVDAESTCKRLEEVMKMMKGFVSKHAMLQHAWMAARLHAKAAIDSALGVVKETADVCNNLAELLRECVAEARAKSCLRSQEKQLKRRVQTVQLELAGLEHARDRAQVSLDVLKDEVDRASESLGAIAKEVEGRNAENFLQQERERGRCETGVDEQSQRLDMQGPLNDLIARNQRLLELIEECAAADDEVDLEGDEEVATREEAARERWSSTGGGKTLLGDFHRLHRRSEESRTVEKRERGVHQGGSTAHVMHEYLPNRCERVKAGEESDRMQQLSDQICALTTTRDQLMAETERYLAEISCLIERKKREECAVHEIQHAFHCARSRLDASEGLLRSVANEALLLLGETARAYKDAKQGEHAIVYLQEAHQACDEEHARVLAEMLREQQQQKRKKCQMLDSLECIRREIQLHEVKILQLAAGAKDLSVALNECVDDWELQAKAAHQYSDNVRELAESFRQEQHEERKSIRADAEAQHKTLVRELQLCEQRIEQSNLNANLLRDTCSSLQETVSELKSEERDVRQVIAKLKEEEAMACSGVKELQEKLKQLQVEEKTIAATITEWKQNEQGMNLLLAAQKSQYKSNSQDLIALEDTRSKTQMQLARECRLLQQAQHQYQLLQGRIEILRGDLRESTSRARRELKEADQLVDKSVHSSLISLSSQQHQDGEPQGWKGSRGGGNVLNSSAIQSLLHCSHPNSSRLSNSSIDSLDAAKVVGNADKRMEAAVGSDWKSVTTGDPRRSEGRHYLNAMVEINSSIRSGVSTPDVDVAGLLAPNVSNESEPGFGMGDGVVQQRRNKLLEELNSLHLDLVSHADGEN